MIDVPRERVWRAWTVPEQLEQWFCPRPWKAVDCEVDLRPGGVFRTLLRGPGGEEHPVVGCYLDVVPQERLVGSAKRHAEMGFHEGWGVALDQLVELARAT